MEREYTEEDRTFYEPLALRHGFSREEFEGLWNSNRRALVEQIAACEERAQRRFEIAWNVLCWTVLVTVALGVVALLVRFVKWVWAW